MTADGSGWRTDRPTTAIYALISPKNPIPGFHTPIPEIAQYHPDWDVWIPGAAFDDHTAHDQIQWHPLPPPSGSANEC